MSSNWQGGPFGPDNGVPESATASGRVKGASAEELRSRGLNGHGHPVSTPSPRKTAGQGGVSRPGGSRGQNISQLAASIGDLELANQDDLRAFVDAVRAVLAYIAVSTQMAGGQLKAAARAQAKQSAEGRLTVAQKLELAATLKLVSRDLNGVAESCSSGAVSAVKAWRRFETFLADLENNEPRKSGGRRGFTVI